MSKTDAWMPLYVGDYLADTMHLNAQQHGAYLLLLMHYWRNGPLLNDDAALANIARVSARVWRSDVKVAVFPFFEVRENGRLHQKRIDAELERVGAIRESRREAGRRRGKTASSVAEKGEQNQQSDEANAGVLLKQTSSKSPANAEQIANKPPANGEQIVSKMAANGVAKPEQNAGIAGARQSQSQSQIEDSASLRSAGGEPPPDEEIDDKTRLWREGLAILRTLTRKGDGPTRNVLGKMSDLIGHDHAGLLDILRQVAEHKPDDPVAWIKGAIRAQTASRDIVDLSDRWGFQAWLAQQRDVRMELCDGQPKPCIGGFDAPGTAEDIIYAAGLPHTWRGNLDAIGRWMRDGIMFTPSVLAAITSQANRMHDEGQTIRSLAVFDTTVRSIATRAA